MRTLGIIGFGHMGSALGQGVRSRQPERPWGTYDPVPDSRARAQALGGRPFETLEALVDWADVLVLAIKPQELEHVCSQVARRASQVLVISVAAGRSLRFLQEKLGHGRLARWMPNLAASVGECLVGVAHPADLSADDAQESLGLAETLGGALLVPEKLLNAVTGVSGSGLAFVFSFLHGMALGGVQQGLPYPQALALAVRTCQGAARLLQTSGKHPEELIAQVCSPAGTTIEGIRTLERSGFQGTVMEAVLRAAERSAELES